MEENASEASKKGFSKMSCDQEAFLLKRLQALVDIAVACEKRRRVGADSLVVESAINGAVHATAVEVAGLFGACPCYRNIWKGELI